MDGEPAVWSIMDGWIRLFPGLRGDATGISSDGNVVVGSVNDSAFVWRANQAPQLFPSPSSAWALDDAGRYFILWRDYAALHDLTTGTDIKVWPSSDTGYNFTIRPTRISRDGSTVIGTVSGSGRTERGFVERIGGTYIPLPNGAIPQAVSADGSLVAGIVWDNATSSHKPFVWSESTGITVLPTPPVSYRPQRPPMIVAVWRGVDGYPKVLGSVIVDFDNPEGGWIVGTELLQAYAAVIWTNPTLPPRYLRVLLQELYPAGDPLFRLGLVTDATADGNVIVGISGDATSGHILSWRAELATSPSRVPTPELSNLSPSTVPAGSGTFTLTVEGRGFRPNAVVQWNGYALPTEYVSPTLLKVEVPDWAVASPGTAQVAVFNPYVPPPGGKRSNELTFTIGVGHSPVLSLLSPSGVRAGATGVQLRVQGSYFTSGSQIQFDGTPLATTFVSSGELRANLPDGMLATPGTYTVRVYEPSLNDYSNSLPFVVTVAIPSITRLNPNSVLENPSSDFTIRVTGTGFESGAKVYFDWTELTTTYISSTELRATVPKSLAAQVGTHYVSVLNPGSGWWSNATAFRVMARRVNPPPPPPGTGPGGSPSLRMTAAHIAPNVVSQVFVTIKNEGGGALTGASLTSATLNGLPPAVPPGGFSQLAPGQSVQLIFEFSTPNIRSGQSFVILVTGTSNQGSWSVSRIVTVP
jgi:hypothetical protein